MQRLIFGSCLNLVDEKKLIKYNIMNGSELCCALKL